MNYHRDEIMEEVWRLKAELLRKWGGFDGYMRHLREDPPEHPEWPVESVADRDARIKRHIEREAAERAELERRLKSDDSFDADNSAKTTSPPKAKKRKTVIAAKSGRASKRPRRATASV